jgi:NAD(P)-dependent dehydrogenase (short-subunit alcohol dehydrogenase family)
VGSLSGHVALVTGSTHGIGRDRRAVRGGGSRVVVHRRKEADAAGLPRDCAGAVGLGAEVSDLGVGTGDVPPPQDEVGPSTSS